MDHDRLGRKNVSDYPESRVSLNSTTQFLHDDIEGSGYGLEVSLDGERLGQEIAQQNQVVQGTALKLVVKGQSYLEAGDLINFKLRSVDEKNIDGVEDPVYSGRYVITKIRHQIYQKNTQWSLECAKDSVRYGFKQNDFKIEKNPNHPGLRDTYEKRNQIDLIATHRSSENNEVYEIFFMIIRHKIDTRENRYPLLLCLCTSCSELMLLSSGAGVVASQSPLVKAYNSADMITILSTDTDIKGHAYNSIKPKRKPIFNDND